ncbi:MAG: PfkB family carbohydrate kinase [Bacteroidota bacterium]
MATTLSPVACIGALYTGSERGLAADVLSARQLGLAPHTVCTALVAASHDRVTDLTEVPSDTVHSQLEHLSAVTSVEGVRIGVLGSPKNAEAVLDWASRLDVPVVLEIVASGPSGETVLPARGIDVVSSRLGVADLVIVSRQDAELITGGEIASLDDAQVAAQRITNRGARRVIIHCGVLAARFFDPADDPGGDGAPATFSSDLYFDGEDFSLFELPVQADVDGIQSLHAITALSALIEGAAPETMLQAATQQAVEAVRWAPQSSDGTPRLAYNWRHIRSLGDP